MTDIRFPLSPNSQSSGECKHREIILAEGSRPLRGSWEQKRVNQSSMAGVRGTGQNPRVDNDSGKLELEFLLQVKHVQKWAIQDGLMDGLPYWVIGLPGATWSRWVKGRTLLLHGFCLCLLILDYGSSAKPSPFRATAGTEAPLTHPKLCSSLPSRKSHTIFLLLSQWPQLCVRAISKGKESESSLVFLPKSALCSAKSQGSFSKEGKLST